MYEVLRVPKNMGKKIFEEFKRTYPNLSKSAVSFSSYSLLSIQVYLEDGTKILYDYQNERATIMKDRWKPEE